MSNRQIRRLQEAEERRRKKERDKDGQSKAQRKATAMQNRAPETSERRSLFARLRDYLHEVRVELKKVTWPTQEQMIAFTTVTLITTVALTAVIFGFDAAAKEFILFLVELRT